MMILFYNTYVAVARPNIRLIARSACWRTSSSSRLLATNASARARKPRETDRARPCGCDAAKRPASESATASEISSVSGF